MNLDNVKNVPTFKEAFAKAAYMYANYDSIVSSKDMDCSSKEDYANSILNMISNRFNGMSKEEILFRLSFDEGSDKIFHDIPFITDSINSYFGKVVVSNEDVFSSFVKDDLGNSCCKKYILRVGKNLVNVHDYGVDKILDIEII